MSLLLWRSIYQYKNKYYIDAIRIGWNTKVYTGASIDVYPLQQSLAQFPPDSITANDIRRFVKSSNGYIAASPDNSWLIGDIRYSSLPHSLQPLWAIEVNSAAGDQHVTVRYRFFQSNNKKQRRLFLKMILGQDIEFNP